MQPFTLRFLIPFTLVVLLLASCGDTADDTADTTLAPTTTTVETTTTLPPTTTAPSPESGVTITKDIVYLEMDGDEYLVDVYVPAGEGPWPVVVALHGAPVYKGNSFTTRPARAAAEAGMLVFAPNWVAQWPHLSDMDAEFVRIGRSVQACALAFAQQEAAEYGGDSTRTVVYGYSAGATSGASLVLGPPADLPPGCLAQSPPVAPVGAVLGDAEYISYPTWWDGAFNEDLDEMQVIVAETVDPAFWSSDLPARFRFWAAADGTYPREFDDPWDEDGWFAQRDPDGTIRGDLDELGALEDGTVDYIDNGQLLATRLQQAGIDTTFDVLPGDHETYISTTTLVAYLLDAAGNT